MTAHPRLAANTTHIHVFNYMFGSRQVCFARFGARDVLDMVVYSIIYFQRVFFLNSPSVLWFICQISSAELSEVTRQHFGHFVCGSNTNPNVIYFWPCCYFGWSEPDQRRGETDRGLVLLACGWPVIRACPWPVALYWPEICSVIADQVWTRGLDLFSKDHGSGSETGMKIPP